MFALACRLTLPDAYERRMRIELLRGMALQQRGAMLSMPLSGAALAALGLLWTEAEIMLVWYALLLATIALVLFTNERFIKSDVKAEDAGRWTLAILASHVPNFVALPAIVPLLWVEGDLANNMTLTIVMLVSMPMAAAQYGASLPLAFAGILKFVPLLMLYPRSKADSKGFAGSRGGRR